MGERRTQHSVITARWLSHEDIQKEILGLSSQVESLGLRSPSYLLQEVGTCKAGEWDTGHIKVLVIRQDATMAMPGVGFPVRESQMENTTGTLQTASWCQ